MNYETLVKNLRKAGYTVTESCYKLEPTVEISHNTVPQFWTTFEISNEEDKFAALQFCAEQAVRKIGVPVKGVEI
jgi:hypothetical protein